MQQVDNVHPPVDEDGTEAHNVLAARHSGEKPSDVTAMHLLVASRFFGRPAYGDGAQARPSNVAPTFEACPSLEDGRGLLQGEHGPRHAGVGGFPEALLLRDLGDMDVHSALLGDQPRPSMYDRLGHRGVLTAAPLR